jgi:hypothetical protein
MNNPGPKKIYKGKLQSSELDSAQGNLNYGYGDILADEGESAEYMVGD